MKTIFSVFIFILGIASIANASEFKLDQCTIESKFDNACDVTFISFTETNSNLKIRVAEAPNHFLVGLSSLFLGTFGVHRFILHQNISGRKHLILTGISLGLIFGGFAIADTSAGLGDANLVVGLLMAFSGAAVEVVHVASTVLGGLIYICTPQSKFIKNGGLIYDQSFCAPFKIH